MPNGARTIDSTLKVRRNRRSSTADRRLRLAVVAVLLVLMGPSLTGAAEEGALGDRTPARVRRHCPSCQLPATAVQKKPASGAHPESARLESIKRQILIKLGLSSKPQLPADAVPPRDVVMETLLRAEESAAGLERTTPSSSPASGRRGPQQQQQHPASDAESSAVEDDFYGKTSEIIAFAEPGSLSAVA